MFTPTNEKKVSESKILSNHMNYKQSTHKSAPQASAAMTLLELRKIYLNGEREIQLFIKGCFKEIKSYLSEQLKNIPKSEIKSESEIKQLDKVAMTNYQAATDSILNEAESDPLSYADVQVKIDGQVKTIQFPLNEVISLVWKALCHDEKFAGNYLGTQEQKIQQAHKDREKRLESFFNCFVQLDREKSCHMGKRNALVYLLNHAYEDVILIEDADALVLSFLKEQLFDLFWNQYHAKEIDELTKKGLLSGMFDWMEHANTELLLKTLSKTDVSTKEKLYQSLNMLFAKYGISYEDEKKEPRTYFDDVLNSLNFACDTKKHNLLGIIHDIFTSPDMPELEERNAALIVMRQWIRAHYRPENSDTHQVTIANFYIMIKAQLLLEKHDDLLEMAGRKAEFEPLKTACAEYVALCAKNKKEEKAIIPPAALNFVQMAQSLQQAINQCQKDLLTDEITNYFANFFTAIESKNYEAERKLYARLLNTTIQNKIKLDDSHIAILMPSISQEELKSGTMIRDITPYVINRFFLHAILTKPEDWSPMFLGGLVNGAVQQKQIQLGLKEVYAFVKNNLNLERKDTASALKRDSYPDRLLNQIDYLIKVKEHLETNQDDIDQIPRPASMILLPGHFKTIDEFKSLARLLGTTEENLYTSFSIQVNRIYTKRIDQAESKNVVEIFSDALNSIPVDKKLSFLSQMGNQRLHPLIVNNDLLGKIIDLLLDTNWDSFLNQLGIEFVRSLMKKQGLCVFIEKIPVRARVRFLNNLEIEFVKNVSSYIELLDIVSKLPVEMRLDYLVALGDDVLHALAEHNFLDIIIIILPDSSWTKIVDRLGVVSVQSLMKSPEDLSEFIKKIPPQDRIKFLDKLGMNFVISTLTKNGLLLVLPLLPIEKRLYFLKQIEIEVVQNTMNLYANEIIKLIPNYDLINFLKHLGATYLLGGKFNSKQFDSIFDQKSMWERKNFFDEMDNDILIKIVGTNNPEKIYQNINRIGLTKVMVQIPIDRMSDFLERNEFIRAVAEGVNTSAELGNLISIVPETLCEKVLNIIGLKKVWAIIIESKKSWLINIPESRREKFLEWIGIRVKELAAAGHLRNINVSQSGVEKKSEPSNADQLLECIIKKQGLVNTIKTMSQEEARDFIIDQLDAKFARECINNLFILGNISALISVTCWEKLLTKLETEVATKLLKRGINCSSELGETLALVSLDKWQIFLDELGHDYMYGMIYDWENLVKMLKVLPEPLRDAYLYIISIKRLREMLINQDDLTSILDLLHLDSRLKFLEHFGMQYVREAILASRFRAGYLIRLVLTLPEDTMVPILERLEFKFVRECIDSADDYIVLAKMIPESSFAVFLEKLSPDNFITSSFVLEDFAQKLSENHLFILFNKLNYAHLRMMINDIYSLKRLLKKIPKDSGKNLLIEKLGMEYICLILGNSDPIEITMVLSVETRAAFLENLSLTKILMMSQLESKLSSEHKDIHLVKKPNSIDNKTEVKDSPVDLNILPLVKAGNINALQKLIAHPRCKEINLEACDNSVEPQDVFDIVLTEPLKNKEMIKLLVKIYSIKNEAKIHVDNEIPVKIFLAYLAEYQKNYKKSNNFSNVIATAQKCLTNHEAPEKRFRQAYDIIETTLSGITIDASKEGLIKHLYDIKEFIKDSFSLKNESKHSKSTISQTYSLFFKPTQDTTNIISSSDYNENGDEFQSELESDPWEESTHDDDSWNADSAGVQVLHTR